MFAERTSQPYGLDKEKLTAVMHAQEFDAILLTSPENVYYTTGFTVLPSSGNPILYTLRNVLPFFSLVDRTGVITLICWGFATAGVELGADRIIGFSSFAEAEERLRKLLLEEYALDIRLGIEASCPWQFASMIRDAGFQVQSIDDLLLQLRLVKSPDEVEMLRTSIQIVERTLEELYSEIHIGMSRLDLMREAKARLIRNGATGLSHVTFSFGETNPEIAIDEWLTPGRLVTLDLGAVFNGYASDNRRYVYAGNLPSTLAGFHHEMVGLVDAVGETLVPGASYADVYETALNEYRRRNIPIPDVLHHVGHNIGLQTEEDWIENDPTRYLKAGMVVNIELYATTDYAQHVGNEETYLVGDSGPTRISRLPRAIREVS